jgi:peroxiredoxin
MNRTIGITILLVALAGSAGALFYTQTVLNAPASPPFGQPPTSVPITGSGGSYDSYGSYGPIDPDKIVFSDADTSNSEMEVRLSELDLVDTNLNAVRLSEIQGDRNLLLVILRGAPLCPFCTAQTSRLKNNYEQFVELGCEVAVVFPGTIEDLEQLLERAIEEGQSLPFPMLVDTELNTIRKLDIAGDKALPSTFIIDSNGKTQFAYVGARTSDRPSIKSLIRTLERLQTPENVSTNLPSASDENNS